MWNSTSRAGAYTRSAIVRCHRSRAKTRSTKLSRRAGSFSRPSSSQGRRGCASITARAKSPRPMRGDFPGAWYTLTRSIPQLGEARLKT